MASDAQHKKVLIVVRTYPTPAQQGVEVSCTAAITEDGKWLRLFPVPYRFLDPDKRFRKYQWVSVPVVKPSGDRRPESHKLVNRDEIEILSDVLPTKKEWKARKDIVLPLASHCLCCLARGQEQKGSPTLGIFKPKTIKRLVIKPESSPEWSSSQLAKLRQGLLFEKAPKTELEKVPFKFQYEFVCDDASCSGHTIMCSDWEMGASWRKWRNQYGSAWEEKFRQKYETEMIEQKDTYFYVGTLHAHPKVWIIVGLFYPPKPKAGAGLLFD